MAIRIGCGSWADAEYTGILYPPGLPAKERLSCYAEHFDQVEINSSYYATPKLKTVQGWVKQTPSGFRFDIKLHRAFSQSPATAAPLPRELRTSSRKQKTDPGQTRDLAAYTLEQLQPLIQARKLGTFLLMLSPYFKPDRHVLAELDGVIAAFQPHGLAVEFRHRSWVEKKQKASTLAYFRERSIAWVGVDMPLIDKPGVMPPVDEVTTPDQAYLRLHGRNKKGYLHGKTAAERHAYLYTPEDLKEIIARIRRLARKAKDVHVVANNHARDFAPRTALDLMKRLKLRIKD